MKLGIAGPGRSGTSLLVELLNSFGFSTPITQGSNNYYHDAQAGHETRIDGKSALEIDKDPWLFECIHNLDEKVISEYGCLIIPIRNRQNAITSRVVQERIYRLKNLSEDFWKWNSWGSVPGGAVANTSFSGVSQVLSEGLWDLIEVCLVRDIQIKLIHFPRFALDFEYFWDELKLYLEPKINKQEAKSRFDDLVDVEKIRISEISSQTSQNIVELESIISSLRKQAMERDSAIAERDSAIAERDSAIAAEFSIANSKIWKSTRFYRRLKGKFR